LFELGDFLFEISGVHRLGPQTFNTLMHSLELGLEVSEYLHSFTHFFIHHKLVRYLERNKETGSVGLSLQIGKSG
jgi:hypothetical protein